MNLNEYKTPLTDEFGETPIPTDDKYQPNYPVALHAWVDFARDLERKLALCRDALKAIAETTKELKSYGKATRALAATEPKL